MWINPIPTQYGKAKNPTFLTWEGGIPTYSMKFLLLLQWEL